MLAIILRASSQYKSAVQQCKLAATGTSKQRWKSPPPPSRTRPSPTSSRDDRASRRTRRCRCSRRGTKVLAAVRGHSTVLVVGETGSGKSTQVPQFLLDAKLCAPQDGRRLCVTQPRRVAVLTVSERVAAERGVDIGARSAMPCASSARRQKNVGGLRHGRTRGAGDARRRAAP